MKRSYLYQGRMEDGLCIYCGADGENDAGYFRSTCARHRNADVRGNATCPSCDYYGLYYDTPTQVRCAHCSYTRAGVDTGRMYGTMGGDSNGNRTRRRMPPALVSEKEVLEDTMSKVIVTLVAAAVLSLAAAGGAARSTPTAAAQQGDQYIDNGCYGCPVVWHGWSDDGYAHWTNTCYNGYGCDGWVLVYP